MDAAEHKKREIFIREYTNMEWEIDRIKLWISYQEFESPELIQKLDDLRERMERVFKTFTDLKGPGE